MTNKEIKNLIKNLQWVDYKNNGKQAIIEFDNNYQLVLLLYNKHCQNIAIINKVILLYDHKISNELSNNSWINIPKRKLYEIIKHVEQLGKFTNNDVPDSTIIKILQNKINNLIKEHKIEIDNIVKSKAKTIINLFCEHIDISDEEKEELKRNPYYVKLYDEYNSLLNKYNNANMENKRKTTKIKELRKDNKELIEKINKYINIYGEI